MSPGSSPSARKHHRLSWYQAALGVALLLFVTACGVADKALEVAEGSCVPGDPYYYLVDGSLSTEGDAVARDQADGLAYTIDLAVDDCSHLTVARFGGTISQLDVVAVEDLKPEGFGEAEQHADGARRAAHTLLTVEPLLSGGSRFETSDPIGSLEWACDELEAKGTIVMATDGLMTTPYDVMSEGFDVAVASELGAALAAELPASCDGVLLEVVGLGRTRPDAPTPSSENIEAIRLLWHTIVTSGPFAEGSRATSIDSAWAGRADEIRAAGELEGAS